MRLASGTKNQDDIVTGTTEKVEARISDWISSGFTPMAQYFAARNGIVFLDSAQGRHCPDKSDEILTVYG